MDCSSEGGGEGVIILQNAPHPDILLLNVNYFTVRLSAHVVRKSVGFAFYNRSVQFSPRSNGQITAAETRGSVSTAVRV